MITFQGDLSTECKKKMLKEETKLKIVVFGIMGLLLCIPAVILAILVWPYFWVAVAVILFIVPLSFFPAPKKDWPKQFPTKVIIGEEELESVGDDWEDYRNMENVKCVLDYGNWYFITFNYPHKSRTFICQKDLIKEGTIEEFESLFSGRIIKKQK